MNANPLTIKNKQETPLERKIRLQNGAYGHVCAAIYHLGEAMRYYMEFDPAAGLPLSKAIREFSRKFASREATEPEIQNQ